MSLSTEFAYMISHKNRRTQGAAKDESWDAIE
jgi:hypothetical protein